MAVPVVTALRARGPGRVAVELDGAPWRVVPLEAVYGAGLAVGGTLDRPTARRSGASCGGSRRAGVALRALRAATTRRRRSSGGSPRGAPAVAVRRETVEAAQRAGLVDDRRFALQRAEQLAARGSGDLLIGDDLERQGVPAELVAARDRGARARGGPGRRDRRRPGHEPANRSLPRSRRDSRRQTLETDRCGSGC